MTWWKLSVLSLAVACAHIPDPVGELSGPTLELRLDDSRSDEKLALPERGQEILMRFDPNQRGYVPLTVKYLLASAGRVTLSFYRTSPEGNPGEVLQRIDRELATNFVSNGKDGRWVVERLSVPEQHSPLWVGLSGAAPGAATIWASASDSSWVFARGPAFSLYTGKLPKTPLVRVEVAPTQAPK